MDILREHLWWEIGMKLADANEVIFIKHKSVCHNITISAAIKIA